MPSSVYNLCKEVIYLNQGRSNIFSTLIRCIGFYISITVLHFNQQRSLHIHNEGIASPKLNVTNLEIIKSQALVPRP